MAGILAFTIWNYDVRPFNVLMNQRRAESFPHTQGQILSSQVTTYKGSKGTVFYHASFQYRYEVGDQSYLGRRDRYDGYPNDQGSVDALVSAHPQGSVVDVYYDAEDPANAVLSTKVNYRNVFILFLLTPINLLVFWSLLRAIQLNDWPWNEPLAAGGAKIIDERNVTRLRLPRYQPINVSVLVLALLLLLAGVIMATSFPLMPPMVLGEWLLLGVMIGGAAVYFWMFFEIHSGKKDLVIDEGSRTIQLPLTYKRRTQTTMRFSEIGAVVLNKVQRNSRGGVSYTYGVDLRMADGSLLRLKEMSESRAHGLAAWLREKFGFPGETPALNNDRKR